MYAAAAIIEDFRMQEVGGLIELGTYGILLSFLVCLIAVEFGRKSVRRQLASWMISRTHTSMMIFWLRKSMMNKSGRDGEV